MNRQHEADGISGGLFLIGLGVIFLTGWWWPGIMVAIGIAAVSSLVFRGKYTEAVGPALIFFGIPLLTTADIPWHLFGPMVLIGIGLIVLAKTFYLKDQYQA